VLHQRPGGDPLGVTVKIVECFVNRVAGDALAAKLAGQRGTSQTPAVVPATDPGPSERPIVDHADFGVAVE
jgi:hypothetical protein